MRVLSIVIALIWSSFVGIEASITTATFVTPTSDQRFPVNSSVNVTLTYTNLIPLINAAVIQRCPSSFTGSTTFAQGTKSKSIALPTDYIGACTYEAYALPNNFQGTPLASVSIEVDGTLSISSPLPSTKILAGTNTSVSWTATPSTDSTPVTIILSCSESLIQSYTATSTPFSFPVPSGFYGNSCNFTAQATNYVTSNNPVSVVVTQQMSFTSPTQGSTYPLTDPKLTLTLSTQPTSSIYQPVSVSFSCSSGASNTTTITTNTPTTFYYPNTSYGSCSFSASSSPQNYLLTPTPVVFFLKYSLNFSSTPKNVTIGVPFNIQINSLPLPTIPAAVNVSLWCANSSVQSWNDVSLNTPVSLTINTTVQPAMQCEFKTPSVSANFYQAVSEYVDVDGLVTLLTPSENQKIAAGSTTLVEWSLTPDSCPSNVNFTVTLTCRCSVETITNIYDTKANFTVPTTFNGDSCSFSVSASNYVTGQVPVVITQQLVFVSPISNYNYSMGDPTIPVLLATLGNPIISASVPAIFDCLPETTNSTTFQINTPTNYTYPTSAFGSCTLRVPKVTQAYLVAPTPVNFYLKYNLNFDTSPVNATVESTFDIFLSASPIPLTPQTVKVALICNNTAVQSWCSVAVNQTVPLTLSSSVMPALGCVLQTSADSDTFFQSTSSPIDILGSISILTPTCSNLIPAQSTFNVSWSYYPPSAPIPTFSVSLACPNFTTFTETGIQGLSTNFSVPSNFYGDDCVFTVLAASYVSDSASAVITQQLVFTDPSVNEVLPLSSPNFSVLLSTPLNSGLNASVISFFNCTGGSSSTPSFYTNTPTNYSYPCGSYGICTLSAPDVTQTYLVAPSPISFYLKYGLNFSNYPSDVVVGSTFDIQIDSVPSPSTPSTLNVSLICNSNPVQTWDNVSTNQLVSLNLYSYHMPTQGCVFQTVADGDYFFQATSGPVNVLGTISIAIPVNGTLIPAQSTVPVQWTYFPSNASAPTFNVVLSCPGFSNYSETGIQALSSTFYIPSTFYGSNCSFSVSATNYVTQYQPIVVTQQLTFMKPTAGDVFYKSNPNFNVQLSTLLNPAMNFSVDSFFNCTDTSDTPVFPTNNLTAYAYPSNAYGKCTLSAPNVTQTFLVAPSPVDFYFKYNLTFDSVPISMNPGTNFTISLLSIPCGSIPTTVSMGLFCNESSIPSQVWSNVSVNTPSTLLLNSNAPFGNCVFVTSAQSENFEQATSDSVLVFGTITVTAPLVGSSFASGSNVPVTWTYNPEMTPSPNFTVTLTCSCSQVSSVTNIQGPSTSFPVPIDFYGSSCSFNVTAADYYTNQLGETTITQQISFASPIESESFPKTLLISLVNVNLTTLNTDLSNSISVAYACETGETGTCPALLNTNLPCPIALAHGVCNMSIPVTGSPYLIAPAPVTFFLKYDVTYTVVSPEIISNQTFNLFLTSSPLEIAIFTTPLSLFCNGDNVTAVQTWPSVSVNAPTLALPLDAGVAPGTCFFQTPSNSSLFFQSNSSQVTVLGTISFVTPTVSESISSGSVYNVEWSYIPAATPSPNFNVSLSCPGFETSTVFVQSNSTNFTVPADIYGSSCSFSLEAQGYIPASISVIITNGLSFVAPFEGEKIYLTTPSIPIELVTVNTNISLNITTIFSCNSTPQGTEYFVTNVPDTLAITPSQIGNCSLITVCQPSYLVPPNANVNFTLMYVLNFTSIPANLFLGQDFFIEIDTLTPADVVTPLSLSLFCNGSSVASQVWNNVTVNQNVTLNLNTDIPLAACYFNTSSSQMYDGIISSNTTSVSKVPLVFSLPLNPSTVNQTDSLLVALLSSIVANPIGVPNVVLNCSSGYVANQLVPIGLVPANFLYSSELYGLCDLFVSDPVFESSEIIALDFVYQLSFVKPPPTLYANQNFTIDIASTGIPPANLSSTNLYLSCECSLNPTYTWFNVPINSAQSLQLPANLTESSDCTLSTDGLPNFGLASTSLNVSYIQLYFAEPSETEFIQPGSFPILVTSTTVPSPQGIVNVEFTCPSNPLASRNISVTLTESTTFDYPLDAFGTCNLTVTTTGYFSPTPLQVQIRFVHSFTSVPSPIYVNQPFNITINSTGFPPSDLTTNLTLICQNPAEEYTWPDLNLNQQYTLTVPTSLSPSDTCILTTESDSKYIAALNSTVLYNVQLEFLQPTSPQTFNNTDQMIPILVTSVNFTSLQEDVDVNFVCLQAAISEFINATTSIEQNYTFPTDSFGLCTVSIPLPPAGFNSPTPIPFNITWPLNISAVPDTLYIGQTFDVQVSPVLPSLLAISTSVNLFCDGEFKQNWFPVPFGQVVQLTLSTNLTNSNSCILNTFSDNSYIIDTTSNTFSIVKVIMVFELPIVNSTISIPLSFPLNVSTPVNTSISAGIEVLLTCGSSNTTFPAITNVLTDVSYASDFDGPCSLEVVSAPSYFVLPQIDTFYLKYALSFLDPPSSLMQKAFFFIEIDTSALPPFDLSSTNLSLVCNVNGTSSVVIQSWPGVPFNQQNVLHLGAVPSSATDCVLETSGNDDFFIQISTPVNIEVSISPFADDLTYITPEEAEQFAQDNILFDGVIDLTLPAA